MLNEQNDRIVSPLSITQVLEGVAVKPLFPLDRMVEYFGVVNYATNERVIESFKALIKKYPKDTLYLVVTSAGGPSGTAMSFYDTVRFILRPNLVTVGSGDVDSSGLLVFLAGDKRFVTRHTTGLLHRAGRVFEDGKRITAVELESMRQEDMLKDEQYAAIVAERSRGRLTKQKVLALMERGAVLSPQDFIKFGLADSMID